MGAWGVGIFADDFACDVRGDWRDGILSGDSPDELTRRLVEAHAPREGDPDQAVFWMALAAAQLQTGRLDPEVRERALAIIDAGADVDRWAAEDVSLARQRRKVVDRLAEKLRGPKPRPKRLRQPRPLGFHFGKGDAIPLRDPATGAEGLAVVVDHTEGYPKGVFNPVVELVLWDGGDIPPARQLARLPCIHAVVPLLREDAPGRFRPHLRVATTHRRKDVFGPHLGEVVARGVNRKPAGDHRDGAIAGGKVLTTWSSWSAIATRLGHDSFRADMRLTRDHFDRHHRTNG